MDYLKEICCRKLQFPDPNKNYVLYTDTSSWCATGKENFAVLKGVQRFEYYLRGVQCPLRCDHKPLEPFLSRGMKIAKLDRWALLLQEYDMKFIHIKVKDNVLADAISRLHTLNTYKDPAEVKCKVKPTSVPENLQKSSKTQDKI